MRRDTGYSRDRPIRNLVSFAFAGDEERAAVAAAGGVMAAVHAMGRFPTDSTVQVFFFRVYRSVLYFSTLHYQSSGLCLVKILGER